MTPGPHTVEASVLRRSASIRDDQCVTPSFAGGGVRVADKILAPVDRPRTT
jgi:hypothetical protein